MLQRDYLVRLIERIFTILQRALDRQKAGDHREAREAVFEGYAAIPGIDRALLEALDTPTVLSLVREPQLVRVLARLRATEAEILASLDQHDDALRLAKHSIVLYGNVGMGDDIDDVATVRRMLAFVEAQS